jgi:WD40 repeat protein
MSDSSLFLGLDRNRLAKWDMRTKEGVVQWTGGKDYAQRTNFSCMATSGDGHIVIGGADGKIRLYNANTLTQVITNCCTAHDMPNRVSCVGA